MNLQLLPAAPDYFAFLFLFARDDKRERDLDDPLLLTPSFFHPVSLRLAFALIEDLPFLPPED